MSLAELDILELKAMYRNLGDIINDLSYIYHLKLQESHNIYMTAYTENLQRNFNDFMENLEKFLERIVE